jgi:acetyl-CoA carboxylase biotin carboxyl carrier protein
MLNLDQLRQILELVRQHDLTELEIEQEGMRVKIRKDGSGPLVAAPPPASSSSIAPGTVTAAAVSGVAATAAAPLAAGSAPDAEIELAVVKSPIVGTFYRSPEPAAAAFVEVGSTVKKGQVLCIIEAMKLMNEIDSEYDGEIVSVYVESGQPVQYGERLFAIRSR